jgi:hypothetical protein
MKYNFYSISDQMSEEALSWPFKLYNKTPFHGYTNKIVYNLESQRCLKEMNLLLKNISKPILFHITIGAAMEEMQRHVYNSNFDFQWQQLLPYHIEYHLKNGGTVEHIIISPNTTFCEDTFIEPFFIKFTPHFMWEMVGICHYRSKLYNYNVRIFCTMMPAMDIENEKELHRIFTNAGDSESGKIVKDMLLDYIQTDYDRIFIRQFYAELLTLVNTVNSIGGIVTCFSFAVFNEMCDVVAPKYKNYKLFPEIINILHDSRNVLAEWTFIQGNYLLREQRGKYISYIKPSYHCCDGEQLIIINTNVALQIITEPSKKCISEKKIFLNLMQHEIDILCKQICTKKINILDTIILFDSLDESQIRNMCIDIIVTHFDSAQVLKYIKSFSYFNDLVILYHLNDDQLMNIYVDIMNYSYDTPVIMSKYNLKSDVAHFKLIEMMALSFLLNCTILINYNSLYIKIKHPVVSNGNYIDIIKKCYGVDKYNYLFKYFITGE